MEKFLKLFGFNKKENSLHTEIFSGLNTFIVMAYILVLAPTTMAGVGGKADPYPVEALFTSVAIVSALSCIIMGVWAKRPLCVAPGVGLLFDTMCTTMGYSWQFVITAVFLEGIIFTLLSFTNLRTLVVETIPLSLRSSIGVGVGFFLATLGLRNAGLLGSGSDFIGLASMLIEPSRQLMVICIVLSGVLITLRVKGAVFISIIVSTLIGIPMGVTHFTAFTKMPASPAPLFCQMEWSADVFSVDMIVCIISILFLDIFDTIGTTIGVLSDTKFTKSNGKVSGMSKILQADAMASLLSGIFGTSTCTSYLESAVGVAAGARTGITPLVTGLCFLLALVFSPVFLAIPASVTGAVLVVVSVKMFFAVRNIDFSDPVVAIPSILTIIIMATAGSIIDGIVVGIINYAIFCLARDLYKQYRNRKNPKTFILEE